MLFLILPSSSPVWLLSALLAIVANVAFGPSNVALNAYIPTLAKSSKEVVEARAALAASEHGHGHTTINGSPDAVPFDLATDDTNEHGASEPLLSHEHSGPGESRAPSADVLALKAAHDTMLSSTTARISSQGIALGYSAGIAMLLLTFIPIRMMQGSTASLRLAIGLSGLWWAAFTVPAGMWLPSAVEGQKVEEQEREVVGEDGWAEEREPQEKWSTWREVKKAWKRLGGMLRWREIKKLSNTFVYLAAWFVLSDGQSLFLPCPRSFIDTYSRARTGFTTITSTAILFGKTSLNMSPSALILVGALSPLAGILGSLLFPLLQRRLRLSNLRVLIVLVAMASAVPAYGCLGFLPVFKHGSLKFGGLTTQGEMYALAVYFVRACCCLYCLGEKLT